MKTLKKMFIFTGIMLGLVLTIFFIVNQILNPNDDNIHVYFIFLLVGFIILFLIYKYYQQQENKKRIKEEMKYKAKGVILKDVDAKAEVLLNEIDRLNKEILYKDSQISFMSSHTGQGIILINKEKNIIYSNAVGDELLHLVDTKNNSYIVKIRFASIKAQIDKSFETGDLISKEYLVNHKNISLKTIPTGGKDDCHMLVLADDLSEKVNLQNMKKDFFSFAGHELKTPITILKGYAELIYHQIVSGKEAHDIAGKMIEQSELMTAFVDDMLMLSRLETFTDAPLVDVPLKLILNEVLETFKKEIQEKEVLVRVFAEDITYKADIVDIEKLFKNMIENAIKYNKEKGTIDIRLEQQANQVIFSIQDSGLGIPSEELDRIFERFYRVNQRRNIQGTGLGLSIVKHIVNKYHGQIDVASEVNKYTWFVIVL